MKRICVSCKGVLRPIMEPVCKRCGKPILQEEQEFCYDCGKRGSHFYKEGTALWLYDEAMRRSIAAFKYQGRREYADFYIEQLLIHKEGFIRRVRPDMLIPVPLHKSRQRQRGFNQAGLLARGIGRAAGIPVGEGILIRGRKTTAQKKLNNNERKRNLEQAFTVKIDKNRQMAGKRILLIDDIYTTGSTIEACAAALLEAGTGDVYFLTLCIGRGF